MSTEALRLLDLDLVPVIRPYPRKTAWHNVNADHAAGCTAVEGRLVFVSNVPGVQAGSIVRAPTIQPRPDPDGIVTGGDLSARPRPSPGVYQAVMDLRPCRRRWHRRRIGPEELR
jgi:hypothetical protein